MYFNVFGYIYVSWCHWHSVSYLRAKGGLEQQALLSGGLDRRTPNKVGNSQKRVSISGTYNVTLECADQTLERFSFITH